MLGLAQIVYCVLSAICDAFLLPLFQVVFAPKYSSPTAYRPARNRSMPGVLVLEAGEPGPRRQAGGFGLIGVVQAVEGPEAPVRVDLVSTLHPRAPAPDVALLRDVRRLLADGLARVEVAVHRSLTGRHVGADLDR